MKCDLLKAPVALPLWQLLGSTSHADSHNCNGLGSREAHRSTCVLIHFSPSNTAPFLVENDVAIGEPRRRYSRLVISNSTPSNWNLRGGYMSTSASDMSKHVFDQSPLQFTKELSEHMACCVRLYTEEPSNRMFVPLSRIAPSPTWISWPPIVRVETSTVL